MMMGHDPRKLAVTIIGSKGGSYADAKKANEAFDPKGDPMALKEMGDKDAEDAGLEAAAHEFLMAVDAKDPKAVAEAFKAMMDLCESYEPEEGSAE